MSDMKLTKKHKSILEKSKYLKDNKYFWWFDIIKPSGQKEGVWMMGTGDCDSDLKSLYSYLENSSFELWGKVSDIRLSINKPSKLYKEVLSY